MRLISQDGKIDLPYDNISLSIEKNIIFENRKKSVNNETIISAFGNGSTISVAKYNNENEAKAILKRIRDSYIKNKTYFQFPEKEVKNKKGDDPNVEP